MCSLANVYLNKIILFDKRMNERVQTKKKRSEISKFFFKKKFAKVEFKDE